MLKTKYVDNTSSMLSLSAYVDRQLSMLDKDNKKVISVQYSNTYAGKDNLGRSQFIYEALIVYEDN